MLKSAQRIQVPNSDDLAVISWSEYEQLVELASLAVDVRDYHSIKTDPGEIVPHSVVKQLSEGKNPIRIWRKYRDMTARSLAKDCGITPAHLSQIENGKRDPSLKLLKTIAKQLEVEVDDLIWD
ncbi:MAG: helix-turn-helix transcriptional regulator [Deltaproteobacteria bacterium]|nr:helix-turn-helix transcriptional regulator [Deltaproteobacteria bacterium]